jgi:predicted nuclease with TOPRIM domain
MKKYNLKNSIDIQKKFSELKQERKDLRVKLDKFQKEFEQNHKRKIRYSKDIAPVSQDFKRYKDLKGELAKFELLVNTEKKSGQI